MDITIVIVLVVLLFIMISDKLRTELKNNDLSPKRKKLAWSLYAISVVALICTCLMYGFTYA